MPDQGPGRRRPLDADVAVVGVGTMGSMALWRLARDGLRVIGFEQHEPVGHELGAAGGRTRIFRIAYKEGAWYVPLLQRAAAAWAELAEATGTRLLLPTGALTIGAADHPDLAEVLRSAREYGLPHEVLDHDQLAARHPQHRLRADDVGVLDPQGGLLFPRAAIRAAAGLARDLGATVRTGVRCTGIDEAADHVRVHTTNGVVTAGRALVCGGPWTAELLPGLGGSYEVRRVVLHWFRATDPAAFAPERFPVGIRRSGPGADLSFFPPTGDDLVKVNLHIPKETVPQLSAFDRSVPADDTRRVEAAIDELLNGLEPRAAAAGAFVEGYTADGHGLIGPPPGMRRVVTMSGFSGHGFKLSPVLASLAVDQLLERGEDPLPARLALARATAGRNA